jgi:hypothetical protein
MLAFRLPAASNRAAYGNPLSKHNLTATRQTQFFPNQRYFVWFTTVLGFSFVVVPLSVGDSYLVPWCSSSSTQGRALKKKKLVAYPVPMLVLILINAYNYSGILTFWSITATRNGIYLKRIDKKSPAENSARGIQMFGGYQGAGLGRAGSCGH